MISLLLDDPAAADVADKLQGVGPLRISVVNIAEVIDVMRRVHGASAANAEYAANRFLDEVARPVAATREQAERAADIRARYYHRRDCDLSLADCFVVAVAGPDDTLATSDSAVAFVARAEGLDVVALLNPQGRRP